MASKTVTAKLVKTNVEMMSTEQNARNLEKLRSVTPKTLKKTIENVDEHFQLFSENFFTNSAIFSLLIFWK